MLSREDNEVLTRVGPGTPMGELLRRYWMPALLSEELPVPDCPPVRVTLLGERLVAFRDTSGAVGLLPEACPHRGASLFFGRNEECGLRCVYHGWKFDVSGRCVDMPNEPAESNFKDRIRTRAYTCEERNEVIWAYLGPPELKPGFPHLEWATVPAGQTYASKRLQECNWAQALEGGIDSSHVSFLHRDDDRDGAAELQRESLDNLYLMRDGAPKFELVPTEYGMLIGARRRAEEDTYYWRITQWLFPWYTMIPTSGDMSIGGHAWVPIDDENVYTWSFNWHPARPLSERELTGMRAGRGLHMELIPGTFRGVSNRSNDYRIDRARQASGVSFTGIEGLGEQDACIQESMGPIFDRAQEHLGSTDAPIIQARRRLISAATELQRGIGPPALDPALYAVRSATLVLPREGVAWPEAAREALTARPGRYVAPVYTV
jgi:phenylpropionate dioxygenase-like ring-hydroxylating dioxygenase large terminal subunit